MHGNLVTVRDLSKIYRLYDKPFDRVRESLSLTGKPYHRTFQALSEVSFALRRGESLGILGKNGHGKSTLLKIIAGQLQPSFGSVSIHGRVAAILELSSNLNPELSGRKNIDLGIRISGVPANEREFVADDVVRFADIGEFIDQPVKTYSSGMKSRLGFALATSVSPDVLILDEVLSVGDFEFQQRCLERMNAMRQEMGVLFVSHSMNAVRHFCDNAIVLESGRVSYQGTAEGAIQYYVETSENDKAKLKKSARTSAPFFGDLFENRQKVAVNRHGWRVSSPIKTHDRICLEFDFELRHEVRQLIIGVPIWSVEKRTLVTSIMSDFSSVDIPVKDGRCTGTVEIECCLNPGTYISTFNVRDGVEYLYRQLNNEFAVRDTRRSFGDFSHRAAWEFD